MKNRKKLIITILQIVAVIVFALSYKMYNDNNVRPVQVYGFGRTMDAGVKITEKDLIRVPVSQMTYNKNMIMATEANAIIGRYTTTKVFENSISYRQQLGDLNTSNKFASLDLANARVISLPINFVEGIAGDLQKGDKIDLLYKGQGKVTNALEGEQADFVYSKIFLQDITVYQVNTQDGYKFVPHANSTPNEAFSMTSTDDSNSQIGQQMSTQIASISLVVTPEQAEQIEARRLSGELKFVKRFPESESHETLGFVIGNYGKIFSGNANAETGSIQIIESFTDEETTTQMPNMADGASQY